MIKFDDCLFLWTGNEKWKSTLTASSFTVEDNLKKRDKYREYKLAF